MKSIIEIKDEVNCKIIGLDTADRRTLSKKFEFEIPGAQYMPSVRLGRWNGKKSYFEISGKTYINLLDRIVPYLYEKGYDVEIDDQRNYSTVFEFKQVDEHTFSDKNWPKNHTKEGESILLRDYQVSIVNKFLTNPQSIQEIATGSGKTLITAALSYSCQNFGRTIVIVPNTSLVTQTEADYINLGLDVGVYYGSRKEYDKTHTICTWQSLGNMLKKTKADEAEVPFDDFIEGVVCVIVDEVHQAKANILQTLLTGVMSRVPIRWGLTGTIPKAEIESVALTISLGPVIGSLAAVELQDKGVLSNCHVNIVQFQDEREFRNYQSELKYLLENEDRVASISNLINKIKESGNTLVLVDRIAAGKSLMNLIPNSVFVSGSTKGKDRQTEYESIAIAENKVIIATYAVAAVGINVPRLFNVVLVEAGRSFVRCIQSIGRGLRKAHDKDFVQIWDLTSTCRFSKRHLTERKKYYNDSQYPFSIEKLNFR